MLDVGRLKDSKTKSRFVVDLRNRFSALVSQNEETEADVEPTWTHIKDNLVESAKLTIGLRKTTDKEWINPSIWDSIEDGSKK